MKFISNRMKFVKIVGGILFICYICTVFYFMFIADSFNRAEFGGTYRYNLKLFREIERFKSVLNIHGPWFAFVNLFGNVICFVPMGFFVPFLNKRYRKFSVVLSLTFLFSLGIEMIQLLFQIGVFDVDDLLLNTLGGVIGYIFYYICIRMYIRYQIKKRHGNKVNL